MTYTRYRPALGELQFIVEWSNSLPATTWSVANVSETIISDDGFLQRVKAIIPLGASSGRFVRLRVAFSQ